MTTQLTAYLDPALDLANSTSILRTAGVQRQGMKPSHLEEQFWQYTGGELGGQNQVLFQIGLLLSTIYWENTLQNLLQIQQQF